MSEKFPEPKPRFDPFLILNTDEKTDMRRKPPMIDISLDKMSISDESLKLIQSDLEKIVSDALKKNEEVVANKIFESIPAPIYGKIHFSVDGLNLQPEVKVELLEKLNQ